MVHYIIQSEVVKDNINIESSLIIFVSEATLATVTTVE